MHDPAALLLFAAGTGVFLVLLAFAIAHFADARDVLEEERARVHDEADAFAAFADRLREVDAAGASPSPAPGSPGATTVLDVAASGTNLERVRDIYRETVMAVPHYDEEYDESLRTNMALEFGDDVANAVDGGATLTPQLKGTLVERSQNAHQQRVTLLRQLEGEAEALDDAEDELSTALRSASRVERAPLSQYDFDQLAAEWHLLSDRERECEAVLTGRQEAIQARDREARRTPSGPTFEEYLYGPLEVTYPVLADGSSLLRRVRDARRDVEVAIAARV